MTVDQVCGLGQFLKDYPGMSIRPSRDAILVLKGSFSFSAQPRGGVDITDSYDLEIVVPPAFPKEVPKVTETAQKIPLDGNHHVNGDGTLCMGSPLRLLLKISRKPDLCGFAEYCLVPYLYAVSYKLRNGGEFIFGELAHEEQGIIEDYSDMFGLKARDQVIGALRLLGVRERVANKAPCPCGCGRRLGKCSFRLKLKKYRNITTRSWFRTHSQNIGAGM